MSGGAAGDEPLEYLVARVQSALAADPRVNELGLDVAVSGSQLVVMGAVATDDRRRAIAEVVAGAAPGYAVRNDAVVVRSGEPAEVETLP